MTAKSFAIARRPTAWSSTPSAKTAITRAMHWIRAVHSILMRSAWNFASGMWPTAGNRRGQSRHRMTRRMQEGEQNSGVEVVLVYPYIPLEALEAAIRWRRRRRRLLRVFVVLGLSVPVLLSLYFLYSRHLSKVALREVIAEVERLDPNWRLEDIERTRQHPKREENAAIFVLKAASLIPAGWSTARLEALNEVLPQHKIEEKDADVLRKAIEPALPAGLLARKTLPLTTGFYDVAWSPEGSLSTSFPHLEKARNVIDVLVYLARLQSHDDKHEESWQSGTTILAVARSIGAEPALFSNMVRIFGRTVAAMGLERSLAQGKVTTDDLLAETQAQLSREAAEPLVYNAIRGERASLHKLFISLEVGTRSPWSLTANNGPLPKLQHYVAGTTIEDQHVWAWHYMNRAVDASRLPPQQRIAKIEELRGDLATAPWIATCDPGYA